MRIFFLVFVLSLMASVVVAQKSESPMTENNPFLESYKTPFEVPPFDSIKPEHFLPAIKDGISQQIHEIVAITRNAAAADFYNTILPFDNSGELLSKVSRVFNNLNGANTTPVLQKLAREITPLMTKHRDNISLNPELFKRIKSVYDRRKDFNLDVDQLRVVEKIYNDFVRGGANLSVEDQTKLRTINESLSK